MMTNIFKRLFPKLRRKDPYIPFGGIEPGLDEYALKQRQECIDSIVEDGKTLEEAESLADSWIIMTVQVQHGHSDPGTQYVPRPVWDWDWMWRPMFETREAALEHIAEKRARLLEDSDAGTDTARVD